MLSLTDISKVYGTHPVLQEISLEVAAGTFVVLLGPSGCGKSTLLRIIAGLEPQTRGRVSIDGRHVDDLPPRDRDIAMVFQSYALYPHLTVRDNMAFGLRMRHTPHSIIRDRITEAAALLGLKDYLDRYPRDLSGGQRQRVAMGRAIVRQPKLFLFDEPLSNLDARLRSSLRLELKKLHRDLQATMIYVTHDQTEAMTLGDTIVVLDRGVIQQIGTPEDVYHRPANPFVGEFIGTPPMNLISGALSVHNHQAVFRSGPLCLSWETALPALQSERAHVGIRPEDIKLEDDQAGWLGILGTIEVTENLGADRLLHVLAHGRRFTVRTARGDKRPGEGVTLHLPPEKLHLFVDHQRRNHQCENFTR